MRRILFQISVIAWAFILCIATAATLPASAEGAVQMRLAQIDQSKFPQITLFVSVTDARGKPLSGLKSGDFQVSEDGRAVPVQILGDSGPVHIALVFDRSGSMSDDGKIIGAQNAARTFIGQLRDQDQVALIAFNDQTQVVQGFTSDKTVLLNQISRLQPGGGTALYDAIEQATELVGQTAGRKAIIVLTDGQNNRGQTNPANAIQAATRESVPVYTIGLGSGSDIDENVLRMVADRTGAAYYNAPDAGQLQALYDLLNQQIREAYPLVYTSPRNYQDGTRRAVQITVAQGAAGLNLASPLTASGNYLVGGILGATPPAQPGMERVNLPVFAGLLVLILGLLALPPVLIAYNKRGGRVTRLGQPPANPGPVPMPVAQPAGVPPVPMPRAVPQQPGPMPMPRTGPANTPSTTGTNGNGSGYHQGAVSLAEAPVLVVNKPEIVAPAPARLTLALPLGRPVLTIGRAPGNDLILPVRSVAPRHAELRKENERYVVRALAADAPVYVSYSGDPAQERQVDQNAIKPGSTIRLGTVTLSLSEDALIHSIPFIAQRMTIGSGANADIQLNDPAIAPLQAAVEWAGDRYVLVDLTTANQPYINQPYIWVTYGGEQSQKRMLQGRNALRSGSVIHIGTARLTLSVFEGERA